MSSPLPQFTEAQWEFLAVLEAHEEPVHIEVAGTLAPLLPGPLFNLLRRADEHGIILRHDSDVFGLAPDGPRAVLRKLREINTPDRLSALVDRLTETGAIARVAPTAVARMLLRADRPAEAAPIEIDLACQALEARDHETATRFLHRAFDHSELVQSPQRFQQDVVAAVLELSHLSVAMGKGFSDVPGLLEKARTVAEHLGDRRSRALINLHLGRFLYFGERRAEALAALSSGREEVEDLGDVDILTQSAQFLGLFFFIQGLFKEAMMHYERTLASVQDQVESRPFDPLAPVLMSFCAANLGQFHRAIGILDMYWRWAIQEKEQGQAITYRAIMGVLLLRFHKKREASFHLYGALHDAIETRNALAAYFAKGGLAMHSFLEGRLKESRDAWALAVVEATRAGIVRQWVSPLVLETLLELDRLGYEPIPDFSYQSQSEKALKDPSIHLRGLALRLKARQAKGAGEDSRTIQSYLEQSERYLIRSGDPVELAKTHLEKARLELTTGDRQRARELTQMAWQGLSGYTEEFFPDDLRYLLETPERSPKLGETNGPESVLQRFLDMMEELVPSDDLREILHRSVAATNRFLGAERGGVFLFQDGKKRQDPTLWAACNLTEREVKAGGFRASLALIRKCFRQSQPILVRPRDFDRGRTEKHAMAILCLPVEVGGKVRGVFYHDNAYLDDCFDFLDGPVLVRLVRQISLFVERIWEYGRLIEEKALGASKESAQPDRDGDREIMGRSTVMVKLLAKAEKVAKSESVVLLLGETGVGKELMARWIHRKSPRREGPYVVIDVPTIPENLLESELFGHEKGAFTGADRQKRGRIELAAGGTLFLDEIGELPLSIQSKLLRALDEKTSFRLGGNRALTSDFRPVAATNRNLEKEVAQGRFRQDLYYRINVVPLTLPPLRERGKDVILLARHFLASFARKYSHHQLTISPADEAKLAAYSWPGNIRELKNVMERAVLLSTEGKVRLDLSMDRMPESDHPFSDYPTMDEIQRRYIQFVLKKSDGRISGKGGAAEVLGMDRVTLGRRMKKLGLK